MNISNKGLIELMGHEGVCLEPYLDSVGVWTIGVGITNHDGLDVKSMGKISLEQAIDLYTDRIKAYTSAVDKLGLKLTQGQYDALSSFCYNCGPGNLRKLAAVDVKGRPTRSIAQIGDALMLYLKPPEIKSRRLKEQKLFKTGVYSNGGKVLVFPVSKKSFHPVYSQGYQIDASAYFATPPAPVATPPAPVVVEPPVSIAPTPHAPDAEDGLSMSDIWEWLKAHT
jgi:lysozyme